MHNQLPNLEFRPRHAVTQSKPSISGGSLWLIIFTAVVCGILAVDLARVGFAALALNAAGKALGQHAESARQQSAVRLRATQQRSAQVAEQARPKLLPRYGSPEAAQQGRACIGGTAMTRLHNGWQQDLGHDSRPVSCRDR